MAMCKIATNQLLAKAGLPIAKTIAVNKNTDRRLILDYLVIPLVMKPDKGFGGTGVTLIKTEEDLEQALNKIGDSAVYLAQEYISESKSNGNSYSSISG